MFLTSTRLRDRKFLSVMSIGHRTTPGNAYVHDQLADEWNTSNVHCWTVCPLSLQSCYNLRLGSWFVQSSELSAIPQVLKLTAFASFSRLPLYVLNRTGLIYGVWCLQIMWRSCLSLLFQSCLMLFSCQWGGMLEGCQWLELVRHMPNRLDCWIVDLYLFVIID